jgi:hypothetical protein
MRIIKDFKGQIWLWDNTWTFSIILKQPKD